MMDEHATKLGVTRATENSGQLDRLIGLIGIHPDGVSENVRVVEGSLITVIERRREQSDDQPMFDFASIIQLPHEYI